MLRKCPNHGFEDIAQLSIFLNGFKSDMKMLLDAAAGGTMMTLDAKQVTRHQLILKPNMMNEVFRRKGGSKMHSSLKIKF